MSFPLCVETLGSFRFCRFNGEFLFCWTAERRCFLQRRSRFSWTFASEGLLRIVCQLDKFLGEFDTRAPDEAAAADCSVQTTLELFSIANKRGSGSGVRWTFSKDFSTAKTLHRKSENAIGEANLVPSSAQALPNGLDSASATRATTKETPFDNSVGMTPQGKTYDVTYQPGDGKNRVEFLDGGSAIYTNKKNNRVFEHRWELVDATPSKYGSKTKSGKDRGGPFRETSAEPNITSESR